mgnify:CR=1 FL=1
MRSPLVIVVFLFALLVQSVAAAGHGLRLEFSADLSHAAMHEAGISHHHNHDGTSSRDNSDEAKQHVQHDHCPNSPALPASVCSAGPESAGMAALPALSQRALPAPYLEGPRRPPRLNA